MNKFFRVFLFSFFLLSSLPVASSEEPKREVSVGVVLHLTGDLAMQSAAFREGLELAVEEINNSRTGMVLNLNVEDGQNNPKTSNSAVQKLLHHDDVVAVILSSYLDAMASGPLLEARKIPSLVLWDSSPEIDDIGEYTFAIGPWTPSAGEEAARFSTEKLGAKTAAIVVNSDSWSEAVGTFFKRDFERRGGKVLEEVVLGASETDFRTVISKIKSKKPDVLYSPLVFNLVPFYSQVKQLQLSSTIVSSDIIADEHISKAPQAFEGIFQTGLLDPSSEAYGRVAAAYKAKYGREISMPWFVAVGYDAASILAESISRSRASGADIKDSLYSLQDYAGASARISFNNKGSSPQLEHMYQIKGGKLEILGRDL
jgi:branched-chain amino acid transport system substrate-binding protein